MFNRFKRFCKIKAFQTLDEFLENLPKSETCGVYMSMVSAEFSLTRKEFIEALHERGYIVAANGAEIAFAKSEKNFDRFMKGGDYYRIERNT